MLAQFRALTRGWIARIFLALIAIALAVTLFQGDFQRGLMGIFNPNGVATVAGETVTEQQLTREFDMALRAEQQRAQAQGQTVTREDAIRAGMPQRLLDGLISRFAMHKLASDIGIYSSDAQLAERLRGIPAARDPITGRFSRDAYLSFVREIGYSPAEFERELRNDLSAEQTLQAMSVGMRVPGSYGALALAFESERRVVSVGEIRPDRIGEIPAPTEAQLQTFYEESAEALRIPEFRTLTIVLARAGDFAERVTVPDERIRQEFESRRGNLTTPERRTFVQISARDEASARQAAVLLGRGEDPERIAAALSAQVLVQREKARTDIADPAVAEAVFQMRAGGQPQAISARLSPFAAIRLDAVVGPRTPTLETEREAIRNELALHDGQTAMDSALEAFDEARGGGQSVADAARANGLTVIVVPAIEQGGRAPNGQPAEQLVDLPPDLIRTAFQTQEGEATDFAPVAEGVEAMVQVDRVTAATTRPLAEVREALSQAWVRRERGKALRELGDRIAAAVRGGQSFNAALAAERIPVAAASQALDRATAARVQDRQLATLVFAGNVGDVNVGVRPDASAALLVHVEQILRADLAQNRPIAERLRQQIGQQVGQSMLQSIEGASVARANVKRNQKRIDALFPPPEGADSATSEQQPER